MLVILLVLLLVTVPLIYLAGRYIGSGGDVWEEAAKKAKKDREKKFQQHPYDPPEE